MGVTSIARDDHAGRIPRYAFMVVSMTLFAISILAAIARIAIRLRYQKRLFIDDAFLFLAVVCLCISVAMISVLERSMFLTEEALTVLLLAELPPEFINLSVRYQMLAYVYLSLVWMTIFAVKFSFLFFFKPLVRCIRPMTIYWWVITVITGVVGLFGITQPFIACSLFDLRAAQCWAGRGIPKSLGVLATTVALDIATDILIIVIPIRLLWRVQIKPRQKLGLGVSLCLSVMMMITALARLCGIRASNGAMDITWNSFWHLTEGCIAVTMASSTAFRTFFVAHRSHAQGNANNKPFPRGQEPWKRKVFGTGREINGSQDMTVLPEIPRATFTGMGTLFNGEETEFKGSPLGSDALAEKEDSWPLSWRTAAQRFGDQLCGSLESETTVTATPMGV